MAKRGRKKKFKVNFNISPDTVRSIFAVLLLFFSAIALISFIAPNYLVNAKIQLVFRKMFGMASLVIPFITAVSGLLFIDVIKYRIKELRVVLGLVLLLMALSGSFHAFYTGDKAKQYAIDGRGGGFVGYVVSNSLRSTISVYGEVFALLALFIISLILMFDVSFDKALAFFGNVKLLEKFKKKNQDEIVISPGLDENAASQSEKSAGEVSATQLSLDDANDTLVEPAFEIIPSMSEPQATLEPDKEVSNMDSHITMKPNALPYTDKVWQLPPLDLLDDNMSAPPDTGNIEEKKNVIKDTLNSFGIPVTLGPVHIGPAVTKYELGTAEKGIRVGKIANLQYDLAMALESPTGSVRIEAPIPGKNAVGIEVPNKSRAMVNFRSLITSDQMKAMKSKLGVVLGVDVGGVTHTYDIAKMPHLLIAGATGSGKSVFIHNIIFSIIYKATPQEVKFIMVDPKRVELSPYADIPHLYTPLVTDIDTAPSVFKWAVNEMMRRYKLFESAKARNIEGYNEKSGFQALPYVVIIVDELAEIMIADPTTVEKSIIRIAQLARATGIHLILAAQRPSADIITGLIKANIPCRVAFNVASQVDSRVIIDQQGAEKLLGKGDMLFVPPDRPNPIRLQGAFVADKEIANVVNFLKSQGVGPDYKAEILTTPTDSTAEKSIAAGGESVDPLYNDAEEIVVNAGKASSSLLQRRLSIGYARAARILDELEKNHVVGPAQGSKPREVLKDGAVLPPDESSTYEI